MWIMHVVHQRNAYQTISSSADAIQVTPLLHWRLQFPFNSTIFQAFQKLKQARDVEYGVYRHFPNAFQIESMCESSLFKFLVIFIEEIDLFAARKSNVARDSGK